jgi:folate-binding Fe-S cluster repair protein YgfZ
MTLITWQEAARLAGIHFGKFGGLKAAENMTFEQRQTRSAKANKARWDAYRARKAANATEATTTQQPIGREIGKDTQEGNL